MKYSNLLKGIVAGFALVSMTQNSVAQEGFNLSVKGIPQATYLFNSDNADNDNHESEMNIGVAFGIGAAYNFNDNLGLSLDALYSIEGDKYEITQAGVKSELLNKYQYIKLPLQFAYNTDPSKSVMFRGKVGRAFNFLTGASIENWDGDEILDDNKDSYESFVLGVALNLGVGFSLSDALSLDAGIRADYALTDAISEDAQASDAESSFPFTSGLEIGLRYTIK